MPTRYPLDWPLGRERTPSHQQKRALFSSTSDRGYKRSLTINEGVKRVLDEIGKMTPLGRTWRVDPDEVIISTNVRTRKDGLPYSNAAEPEDSGVAVYFDLDDEPHCLACDKWDRVADNLAAVAAHIGALRGIERWGVGDLRAAFQGYRMLPESGSGTPWWSVLGVEKDADEKTIRKAYRRRAKKTHPDAGGDAAEFQRVQEALYQGLAATQQ